jgi:hypothetical protein
VVLDKMGVGIVDGQNRSCTGATARLLTLCVSAVLVASGCAWVARVSVDSAGLEGNGNVVGAPAISTDGRFVAFLSQATNLVGVAGDTNNVEDVFWRDIVTGTTRRVSVSSGNTEANMLSFSPAISGDGRYVAFVSNASNLVTGDTNRAPDVFVRDTTAGTTTRVSVTNTGAQANGSADWTTPPAISNDGRYVAFASNASNLVAADTNTAWDVFVRDRTLNTTKLVTLTTAGVQGSGGQGAGPRISPDGRYIVYSSGATLVSGDTNNVLDVFVRDRTLNTTTRVSVSSAGAQQTLGSKWPAISKDGRYVTFLSLGTTLVAGDTNNQWDVFVRDRTTNTTTRVNVKGAGVQSLNGNPQYAPAISGDGRYVTFDSTASDLIAGDTTNGADVFVRDRTRNTTTRVSVDSAGNQSMNGSSNGVAISGDGRYIAYISSATNLVTNDTNHRWDVIVRANPDLTVTSASPQTAARGATTTITLTGTHFLPGVSAFLGNNVTLTAVNLTSENQVALTINVESSATTGPRPVVVYNTGTGAGPLTGTAASFNLNIT